MGLSENLWSVDLSSRTISHRSGLVVSFPLAGLFESVLVHPSRVMLPDDHPLSLDDMADLVA
jgi:hypothetical protein